MTALPSSQDPKALLDLLDENQSYRVDQAIVLSTSQARLILTPKMGTTWGFTLLWSAPDKPAERGYIRTAAGLAVLIRKIEA